MNYNTEQKLKQARIPYSKAFDGVWGKIGIHYYYLQHLKGDKLKVSLNIDNILVYKKISVSQAISILKSYGK